MNLLKTSLSTLYLATVCLSVHAQDIVPLPTLQLMAEPELRKETGVIAYQEDEQMRLALQHQILRNERDIQNFSGDQPALVNYEYTPKPPMPDMNGLSPLLQQYVFAIADGLQSSDPTQGLYIMLQPFGINRGNINEVRQGTIDIKEMNIHPNWLNNLQQNQQIKPPRMQ